MGDSRLTGAPFLAKKDLCSLLREADGETGGLRRVLGPLNLVTLGIGAIIGAGIFVLTGQAAATYAGPAIILSFVLSGLGCTFAGLCYAEFASLIPIAGSAYTYGYATLGEIFAWIIGWDLILEYAFGAATVASGWSGYFQSLLADFHILIPPQWIDTPGTQLVYYKGSWSELTSVRAALATAGMNPMMLPHVTATFNLLAFLAMSLVTLILVVGIRESANVNTLVVIIKVVVVLIFIAIAAEYVLRHPTVAATNWHPFVPPGAGKFGEFGWSGIARGAAVVFFAYIGFDAVSTMAQEARNPQRDMPIGIIGSLLICTVLYIAVSGLLTAIVPYTALNVSDPVAVGIDATGVTWAIILVKLGAVAGLTSVMLVMMLGQSRVAFTMSRDGLLPKWGSAIHPRFRTPWITSIVVGLAVSIFGAVIPIGDLATLVNIGTLLAFVIVCAGVWVLRVTRPDLPRPFRTPLVPFVPILGMSISFLMMVSLPIATWYRLVIWLLIGLCIYWTYGVRNSVVTKSMDSARQREELLNADLSLLVLGILLIITGLTFARWLDLNPLERGVAAVWGAAMALIAARNYSFDRRALRT
jgi:APA family basic amino acid/polyamine antiporter